MFFDETASVAFLAKSEVLYRHRHDERVIAAARISMDAAEAPPWSARSNSWGLIPRTSAMAADQFTVCATSACATPSPWPSKPFFDMPALFSASSAAQAMSVSYTHLRAHETDSYLVCRLLLEKKK